MKNKMRNILCSNTFTVVLSIGFVFSGIIAAKAQTGLICGNPANKKCVGQYDGFEPHDLVFKTGRAALGAGTDHKSNEFYAVILESVKIVEPNGAKCNFITETKRRAAQKLFPNNKVFASRQNCSDTLVGYSNTSNDYNFMAVYAGEAQAEAARILAKAKKHYSSANVRRMKVLLDFTDGPAQGVTN